MIGTRISSAKNIKEALRGSGLDWQVQKQMLYTKDAQPTNYYGIRRLDNDVVIGSCKRRYEEIQNEDGLGMFDDAVARGVLKYDTAGRLDHYGAKVFITATLNRQLDIGNDPVKQGLMLITSHDGSICNLVLSVFERIFCSNQISGLINSAKVRVKHTRGAFYNLDRIRDYIDQVVYRGVAFEQMGRQMKATKIDGLSVNRFILSLGIDLKESKQAQEKHSKIKHLFTYGKGNKGESVWDILNAVTEYVDHHSITRGANTGQRVANRARSITIGSGNLLKQKALTKAKELIG